MIKLDLHIHSIKSQYKESPGVVDDSTLENLDILFEKLEENNIALFSITDHNRFYSELYIKIDEIIQSAQYPSVKNVLAGIEFDVKFDGGKKACHIIAIFNADNKEKNYKKIEEVINDHLIESRNGFYTGEEFEKILKEIDLDTILIACQRTSLEKTKGTNRSLSEATSNPYEIISAGYISALEYQSPNVEGMIKSCLNKSFLETGLFTGSDCHQWKAYPNHNDNQIRDSFHFTRAKILPTFKGLMMAVTSPKNRINTVDWCGTERIDSISIGGVSNTIPLAQGITAIIGENGSGKSTILDYLALNSKDKWKQDLIKTSEIEVSNQPCIESIDYIRQGEIVKKFNNSEIFSDGDFLAINNDIFDSEYRTFAGNLLKYLKKQIELKEISQRLSEITFDLNQTKPQSTFYVHVEVDPGFSSEENIHSNPLKQIHEINTKVKNLLNQPYFKDYSSELMEVLSILGKIEGNISSKEEVFNIQSTVKNIIDNILQEYKAQVLELSSYQDNASVKFQETVNNFCEGIVEACKLSGSRNDFPEPPQVISGLSSKKQSGFNFLKQTAYNNKDVVEEFLETMFNRDFQSFEALRTIDTENKLISAVKNCTEAHKINSHFEQNLNKFLEKMHEEKRFIIDVATNNPNSIGNTMGELSLAYFKYMFLNDVTKPILLIDQPEDHISNNHISENLINYFSKIRNGRQIIIVTHNPLLVVNLDVEQVIVLEKRDNKITAQWGPLEYECEDYSILELVAEKMDGGRDAIEKRLKIYGKENHY